MAIVVTPLTSGSATAAATAFVTGTFSVSSAELLIAAVAKGTQVPILDVVNVEFNGTTMDNPIGMAILAPGVEIKIYNNMYTSAVSGAATIRIGGLVAVGPIAWSFTKFSGTDTSGAGGGGAIVQGTWTTVTTASSISTVSLDAFGAAGNVAYGAFAQSTNVPMSTRNGFILLHSATALTGLTSAIALLTEWDQNNTQVRAGGVATAHKPGIAIEIKEATVADGGRARRMMLGIGR